MQALSVPRHHPQPVELLQSDIRRICGRFHIEPASPGGLTRGEVEARRLGRFDTALVSLDAERAERDARAIRADPGEHLFLLVQDSGQARIEQGERAVLLQPGDMYIVDSARPSRFVYGGAHSHQISLHMPRREMLHRFGPACTGGVAILRHEPLWLPMRAVIGRMVEAGEAEGPGLGEALLGLMGAWFAARRDGGRGDCLVTKALALIDRHAGDPGFGPGLLAGMMGVSDRVLQRHFRAALQATPGRVLIELRLDRARARLASDSTQAAIARIAFDCGFNDLSYFYRAFRRRYGQTPGDAQRAVAPGAAPATMSDLSKTRRG